MNAEDMKQRTSALAIRVIRLVESLPNGAASRTIGAQLLRSATSVGANYRAACRARSRADFIAKMGIVEEEADETICWLELLAESGIVEAPRLADLARETSEILAMTIASKKTARRNQALNRQSPFANRL